jgi:hypothetical protein
MTVVTSHTATEVLRVDPLDELRENGFAGMHERILARKYSKRMHRKWGDQVQIAHTSFPVQDIAF